MKKIIVLLSVSLLLVSCGQKENSESSTDKGGDQTTQQAVEKTSDTSAVTNSMACIQSGTMSEPGLDTYSVKTCMSTNTLSKDMFKSLCELSTQLEGADIDIEYVKQCPKPHYGTCKNAAPAQSVQAMGGNWDIYYYDQKDVVTDSSGNPYCKDFEKGAL